MGHHLRVAKVKQNAGGQEPGKVDRVTSRQFKKTSDVGDRAVREAQGHTSHPTLPFGQVSSAQPPGHKRSECPRRNPQASLTLLCRPMLMALRSLLVSGQSPLSLTGSLVTICHLCSSKMKLFQDISKNDTKEQLEVYFQVKSQPEGGSWFKRWTHQAAIGEQIRTKPAKAKAQ